MNMAQNHPSTSTSTDKGSTTITDMDMDSLVYCASYLTLHDLSNMAVSCRYLNRVVYSDSIWRRLFRERWPQQSDSISQLSGVREAYLARYTALQQFKFVDPLECDLYMEATPHNHAFFSKNDIFFSQGPVIYIMKIDSFLKGKASLVSLTDHRARITSMRLFPLKETSLFRSEAQINENVLVTSSCDHSIRLWWKGSCQRCFRGHNGPVTVLSDKLLGDRTAKVFASGGEDSTVRLWSLNSSGKRGQHALKATLYGHEKPIVHMSVTGHSSSLVVSMSKDFKVRVWDAAVSSSDRDSSCVGMTTVPGAPVGMKCHESLLYIAAGSSMVAVDLRTMRKVFSTATNQGKLHSFDIMPSKFLACTGGDSRAMLWDIRKSGTGTVDYPLTELDGHIGPVTHLHMDRYKIVTGGPEDAYVNVWETDTGNQANSLTVSSLDNAGCCAMAVDGCRIVTASCNQEEGILRLRDFNNANCSVSSTKTELASKFWGLKSSGDTDDESDS